MTSTSEEVVGSVTGITNTGAIDGLGEIAFDPRKLALGQNFVDLVGVKRETLRVPIQRPPDQAFFVAHPEPAFRIAVPVIVLKEEREHYIVDKTLLEDLRGEWLPKMLVACQTRQGGVYFWPIRLAGADGKLDTWNTSALQIASRCAGRWIRVTANRELGAYDVIEPISPFPDPVWTASADELLKKAFHGRVIDSLQHPVVKHLRGLS